MEVAADFFSKLIGADRIVNLVAAFLLAGLYFAYLYIYRHKQFKTPESLEAKRIDSISYDKVLAKIDTETANELARKKADDDAKKSTGSIITIRQGLYGVAIFFLIMVLSEIVFRIYIGNKEPNLTENIQNVLDLQTDNIILKNDSNTLTQILCEFGYQGNKEISVSAFFCSKSNHDSSCSGAEYSNHKVSKGKNTLDFTLSKNEDCLQKISKDDLAVCFYFKEGTKEVFKKTIGFSELRKQ